jgi:hypothetical protein
MFFEITAKNTENNRRYFATKMRRNAKMRMNGIIPGTEEKKTWKTGKSRKRKASLKFSSRKTIHKHIAQSTINCP